MFVNVRLITQGGDYVVTVQLPQFNQRPPTSSCGGSGCSSRPRWHTTARA